MKVIDLLNKIANGEEVPKKIAIQNEVLIYNEDEILNLQDCYYMADEEDATWRIWAYELNDEVEILEEKKLSEKLEDRAKFQYSQIPTWFDKKEIIKAINENFETHQKAIYALIDYLKSKGE